MGGVEGLRARLVEFQTLASGVWAAYQDAGPGRVDAALFEGGEAAAADVIRLLDGGELDSTTVDVDALRTVVERVCDLARRCATRPEGLCFITGEAGLVPRREWHAAMEAGLEEIGDAVARLERGK